MNRIEQLSALGQSVWIDTISRQMIDSGELRRLIDLGVVGLTSNPTIFMKAITGGPHYDELFVRILSASGGASPDLHALMRYYEKLILPDIADAADMLRPVYDRTGGVDGYVSLEVNPKLAYNTPATIAEARRLFRELARPNVFIKVPATQQGIPAIETLIGEGVNVNVTLIFSIKTYMDVAQAYLSGLKRLHKQGGDLSKVASVASFFVSRVDTAVDKILQERCERNGQLLQPGESSASRSSLSRQGTEAATVQRCRGLFGKAAIANAKLAYQRFKEIFDSAGPFGEFARAGARVQRPLWASTSTKNPAYSDTMYADNLIGPHTVNTMPPETLSAVLDHGRVELTLEKDLDEARHVLAELGNLGIDMGAVTDQLTFEGVRAFAVSFQELLDNLAQKESRLRAQAVNS